MIMINEQGAKCCIAGDDVVYSSLLCMLVGQNI